MALKKTVQYGDAVIELETLSLGGHLDQLTLMEKFVPPPAEDASREEKIRFTSRWNYIEIIGFTRKVSGVEVEFAKPEDTPEEFERKLRTYLALELELTETWVEGVEMLKAEHEALRAQKTPAAPPSKPATKRSSSRRSKAAQSAK